MYSAYTMPRATITMQQLSFFSLSIYYAYFPSWCPILPSEIIDEISSLPSPMAFVSILLTSCAGPDTGQLILLRMIGKHSVFRKHKITYNVFSRPWVFAHRKTGKFSFRLLNKSVSTEIIVQKLTTAGTEHPTQALCKHEGTCRDPGRLCNIGIFLFF